MTIQDIKKEFISGIRENKFLVLAVGLLFFALLDPVMVKLMPSIMQSQFPDMPADVFNSMVNMTQLGCVQNYMGDIFEIGTIIIVFTLCGIISQELKENTLVLPVCSGKSFAGIVLSKFMIYGVALLIIPVLTILIDYAYAGVLFGFDMPSVIPVIRAGLLEGVYMVFILSSMLMFGVFTMRPIATGILSLILVYGLHFAGSLFNIMDFVPSGMLDTTKVLAEYAFDALPQTIVVTLIGIVIYNLITIWRLKTIELNVR